MTSEPTSDSSDTGGSGKSNDEPNANSGNVSWNDSTIAEKKELNNEPLKPTEKKTEPIENTNFSQSCVQNNLKSGSVIYLFKTICYKVTNHSGGC